MKKIIFFFLVHFSVFTYSQTLINNDNVTTNISAGTIGNSFTATIKGSMTELKVCPDSNRNTTLQIYSGVGIGGTLLYSQSATLTDLYQSSSLYSYQTISIPYGSVSLTSGSSKNTLVFQESGGISGTNPIILYWRVKIFTMTYWTYC